MKNLLRFFTLFLMVGGAYAQGIPQRVSTELISDCYLLFSKGTNGNLAYWDINFLRKKAFAIGTPSYGNQVCQYQSGGGLRFSDDEIKELAITECNKRMPTGTGCFLYARNNEIIYDKESHHRQLNQNNTSQQATSQPATPRRCDPWCWEQLDHQKLETATISPILQPSTEINRENKFLPALVQQASTINQTVATATQQATVTQSNLPACVGHDVSKWSNCAATQILSNGHKYIGGFQRGRFNGQGAYYSPNGIVISEGLWVDDKLVSSVNTYAQSNLPRCLSSVNRHNCFDSVTYVNGDKYVGEFKDGKANGLGTSYASNGSIINQGIWAGNVFVRSAPEQQAVAPTLQPSTAERDRLTAEVEVERKKRQELEQQLAAAKDRDRITSELEAERKKRQELEAQLAASVQPTPPQTNAPRRIAHALVIGNAAYPGSGRLDNPVNDANAISQKLRSMGFIVTTVTDANRQRLVQSMAQFRRSAATADISLLYYAGHGVQIFGTNYILPTDVDQTDPAQATIQGVSLNSVVENFLPGKTKLVFLDACRDNALQRTNDRSVSKGLAPISAAEGTLISYATKDGQTAADGAGSKNSPFTQALLEHLNDPQDIAVVLRKVRERVMQITGGKQQPWEYGSLTGGELVLSAIKPK